MRRRSKRISSIERTLDRIAVDLERSHFYEYVDYVSDSRRMLSRAFLSGMLRGLGMAVGFTLLGALIVWILNVIARSNIPYIADFISRIVEIVESNRR